MIIYTCPKCGHDLESEVLTCYPPIHRDFCPNCGWSHSSSEKIIRIPFGGNLNTTTTELTLDMIDLTPNEGDINLNEAVTADLVITTLNNPIQPSDAMYESSPCAHCPNNSKNGGSGICHCILGSQEITY